MAHIFISYSKKDTRQFAIELAEILNSIKTVTAWMDKSLENADSWAAQIESEIVKCDYFVVLLSPDVNRHHSGNPRSFVLNEISFAQNEHKIIIPVMVQMTRQPIEIAGIQYIEATGNTNQGVWKVVEDVCIRLGVELPLKWKPYEIAWPNRTTMVILPVASEANSTEFQYALAIAKHPVTNNQYKAFVEETQYSEPEGWDYRHDRGWEIPLRPWNNPKYNHPEQPVVCISHFDAMNYCNWLTSKLDGQKAIMPSREVWSLSTSMDIGSLEDVYYRGQFPNNFEINKNRQATVIFNKEQPEIINIDNDRMNGWGVIDLIGNIWQWGANPDGSTGNATLLSPQAIGGYVFGGGSFLDQEISNYFISGSDIPQGYMTKHSDLGFRHAGLVAVQSLPEHVVKALHESDYHFTYSPISKKHWKVGRLIQRLREDSRGNFPVDLYTNLLLDQIGIEIYNARYR